MISGSSQGPVFSNDVSNVVIFISIVNSLSLFYVNVEGGGPVKIQSIEQSVIHNVRVGVSQSTEL